MTIAFFYQQPTVLDREQHRQLKLKPQTDSTFAEKSHVIPLLGIEFPEACLEYAIVFNRIDADNWVALAVTGLADGENLFVDAKKQWSGRYVPACIRRYPFILVDNGNDPFAVAIDLGSPNVGEQIEGGEALFAQDGEPGPALQSMMNLLSDFQGHVNATQGLIKRLAAADLLVESNMQVSLPDGRSAGLNGGWIIDEARLRNLSDATAAAWFRTGELALVYAHLLSLRNLPPLLQRRAVASAPVVAVKTKSKA